MNKKTLLSILLAGTMAASLTACGGSDKPAGGDAGAAGGEAAGNKLTVYAWDKSFNIPALEAAAAVYKQTNPDFELEIIEQAGSGDVETAITTAASAGNLETLPDIVLFQDHYIQNYVTNYPNAWVPVEGADIKWDDFSSEKLSYSLIDGQHYGVPVDNGAVVTCYRKDLVEEAGYSVDDLTNCTWEKFIEIGEAVYAKTGKYLLCMDGDGNDLIYMMGQAEGVSQFKDGAPNFTDPTVTKIVSIICEMAQKNVLYLANSWSDYTDQAIQGDMVAGVLNGNWIIPTMKKVEANSGKWVVTNMPTINGGGGYASNGGSSLYITGNCKNVDLAKDFLAKTFGSSTEVYDQALTNGGVISCYAPAASSEIYGQGDDFFGGQSIYADIVEMGTHVATIEQNDFHYSARKFLATAIINVVQGGADLDAAIQEAQDQLNFEMGN